MRGPCKAWYGASAIGNVYTASPDASANGHGHRYFRPASVTALAPPTPVAVASSVELAQPTTASDSNNTPQGFYEIEAHFLKGPELTTPPTPTVYTHVRLKTSITSTSIGISPTHRTANLASRSKVAHAIRHTSGTGPSPDIV